jgi:hypothetical protein
MKESSDGFLTFLKVCSFCILSVTLGVVVQHNVALRRDAARGGRTADVEVSDFLGYGFAYGCAYGYRYGYGYGHAYGDEEFTADRGARRRAARRETTPPRRESGGANRKIQSRASPGRWA